MPSLVAGLDSNVQENPADPEPIRLASGLTPKRASTCLSFVDPT